MIRPRQPDPSNQIQEPEQPCTADVFFSRFYIALSIIVFTSLCATACSKQAWYTGVQASQERECINEQDSAYDECRRSTSQSYDEYQNERVRF